VFIQQAVFVASVVRVSVLPLLLLLLLLRSKQSPFDRPDQHSQ
jgi:hypothetical protein